MISLRDLASRNRDHYVNAAEPTATSPVPETSPPSSDFKASVTAENRIPAPAMAETGKGQGPSLSTSGRRPMKLPKLPPPPPATGDQEAFRQGFAWLHSRGQALATGGWTRPELYRRNRARRGIAWLALWADQAVTPELLPDGGIRFHIKRPGRQFTQTARPTKAQATRNRGRGKHDE